MREIRVLHIVYTFGTGGLEHGVAKLANHLSGEKGFVIDILAFAKTHGKQYSLPQKTKYIQYDINEKASTINRLFKLVKLIKAGRYDIVHTHNWPCLTFGAVASRICGVPVIIHGEHGSKSFPNKGRIFQRIITRFPMHYTAICKPLAEWMEKNWHIKKNKITCIPNGVDTKRFYPKDGNCRKDIFTIGSVGRLEKVKNFSLLINAFNLFLKKNQNVNSKLLIVGEGSEREALEIQVESLALKDDVIFTGEIEQPENQYREMDLYVNANTNTEGMNNCMLEAMACGVPIISADLETNRSWLTENENVLFFKSEKPEFLTEKINYIYMNENLRKNIAVKNSGKVLKKYTMEKYIEKYSNLYRNLANKKC